MRRGRRSLANPWERWGRLGSRARSTTASAVRSGRSRRMCWARRSSATARSRAPTRSPSRRSASAREQASQTAASGRGDAGGDPQVPRVRVRDLDHPRGMAAAAQPQPASPLPHLPRAAQRLPAVHADTAGRLGRTTAVRQSRHQRGSERGLRDPELHRPGEPGLAPALHANTPLHAQRRQPRPASSRPDRIPRGPPPDPDHRPELADYWRSVEQIAFATKRSGPALRAVDTIPEQARKTAKEKGRGKQSFLSVVKSDEPTLLERQYTHPPATLQHVGSRWRAVSVLTGIPHFCARKLPTSAHAHSLLLLTVASGGENRWPPVGRSDGRPWGELMAARGDV